jgi:hypothetical protein
MMKTGGGLFPALKLDTKRDVDVVKTVGYPQPILAILIRIIMHCFGYLGFIEADYRL